MSTVDEILASGWYRDRRGRRWHYDTKHRFWLTSPPFGSKLRTCDFGGPLGDPQMRLLIERDQHQDECKGLYGCDSHPVPKVTRRRRKVGGRRFWVWSPFDHRGVCASTRTLPEAMDAARALAVGE